MAVALCSNFISGQSGMDDPNHKLIIEIRLRLPQFNGYFIIPLKILMTASGTKYLYCQTINEIETLFDKMAVTDIQRSMAAYIEQC